jgi:hypothetical protein
MQNFCSGTCAQRTQFFPPCSSTIHTRWLRHVCEKNTFLSHPSFHHAILLAPVRVQAMWRWSCSMQIQRPSPSFSTPPFHHAILLALVCVREFWRWSSSMQIQRHSPSVSTPPFHHTRNLAPVRVRNEHRSFPPRPSTITNYWLRCVCEKDTVLPHPALPP